MKIITFICDICGEKGHDVQVPGMECIEALQRAVRDCRLGVHQRAGLAKRSPYILGMVGGDADQPRGG